MKTENLIKTYHDAQFLASDIRQAHADAADSNNQLLEILLFELIEVANKLENKLKRITDAADDCAPDEQ